MLSVLLIEYFCIRKKRKKEKRSFESFHYDNFLKQLYMKYSNPISVVSKISKLFLKQLESAYPSFLRATLDLVYTCYI